MRPLVVGEAPSRTSNPARPISARCGAALAEYAGLTVGEFCRRFERRNLLSSWPGLDGKGTRFSRALARVRAEMILRAASRSRPRRIVILLGKRVGSAFGVRSEYFARVDRTGARLVVVPHPSGINRWYNDPSNRRRMRRFMRRAARVEE